MEIADPGQRSVYLDGECAGDAALKQHIEGLLAMHARAGSFLESPAPGLSDTATVLVGEEPGAVIGPYKLMQKLGEGGMGVVWVAEQQEPVKRRVALKVIKPGLGSAQVLRRFEAERQALAVMDHNNIARVLDAGATNAGLPYFVMELVHGVTIMRYCDELQLSVRERLELLIPVCQAIQHAHQKGILHRDIKPSNVLVCIQDGKPVPKVIDFGVAKAMHQTPSGADMTDTAIGAAVGTLEYMSPEQAEMSPLGVDTRTDVYALGVLMYELLTGSTPLDMTRLRTTPYAEIVRRIREEDPPKPSTRLTASKEALAGAAAARRTQPSRLTRELRGELDWIVMKALEKDRTRRYEGAGALARDIERHLRDEPVEACPPSTAYRLKKFVRRNKGPVVAATSILLLLIAGIIGTTSGLVRAERARDDAVLAQQAEASQKRLAEASAHKARAAADAERKAKETAEAREAETRAVLEFVDDKVFAAARPKGQERGLGSDVKLREAVEAALPFVENSFTKQPLIEARLRMTLGNSFWYLGDAKIAGAQFQAARAIYSKLGADHPDTLSSMMGLANSYAGLGRHKDALKLHEETLALRQTRLGPSHRDTLTSMNNVASSYDAVGRRGDALELREKTLALRQTSLGPDHPDTLASMMALASSYYVHGRQADALKLYEDVLELRKVRLGPHHPDTLRSMNNLANSYAALERRGDALKLRLESLELHKAKLGPTHPDTLAAMGNLATSYLAVGRRDDARKLREETLALQKIRLGPDHPDTLRSMSNLATSYTVAGRHADALKLHEETRALRKAKLGSDHPDTLLSMGNVAVSLATLDRAAEAVAIIDDCIARASGKVVAPGMVAGLLDLRLRHFQKHKDGAGCRATAEMWEKLGRSDAAGLYNAACLRAVTAAVIRATDGSAAGAKQAGAEADRGMAALAQAVAAGFNNAAILTHDSDLDILRDREDFKKLLTKLKAKRLSEKKAATQK